MATKIHQNRGSARMETQTFESLYEQYAQRIFHLAYRMTFNQQVAEDLTQDIFIKIYHKLPAFRGESHVYTWIYRIAVNHILNYLKKEKRQRWYHLFEMRLGEALKTGDEVLLDIPDPAPSPAARLESQELLQLVRKEILTLPPKYRMPFILHRYEKMNHKEIANLLGLSISAVETRIHRATKQLVSNLEKKLKM